MNILLNILNLEKGGAQRVMINLANGFTESGHDVTLVSCFHDASTYPLDPHIRLIYLDGLGPVPKNGLWRFYLRRKSFAHHLSDIPADIIISFLPESNFLLLSLRNRIKAPVIISLRNDPNREYRTLIRNLLMRYLYAKADGFVYQTQNARDYFKSMSIYSKPSVILSNPVDVRFFRKPQNRITSFKIVSVGRLVKQKNHRLLIDAFQQIHQRFPEYRLEIYGEGPLQKTLEERIHILDLGNYVTLKGVENEMDGVLSDACMFVLSSDYEGMPNALIEAMAMGLCVVSTDCEIGGPRFLIRDRVNGCLVKSGDQVALVQIISELLEKPEWMVQLGNNAYGDAQRMKLETIIPQWLDFMNELIDVK